MLSGICCDSPATSFMMNIKTHSAYYACRKCITRGLWVGNIINLYSHAKTAGQVIYLELDAPLRTDDSFRKRLQVNHHKNEDPFPNYPLESYGAEIRSTLYKSGCLQTIFECWEILSHDVASSCYYSSKQISPSITNKFFLLGDDIWRGKTCIFTLYPLVWSMNIL